MRLHGGEGGGLPGLWGKRLLLKSREREGRQEGASTGTSGRGKGALQNVLDSPGLDVLIQLCLSQELGEEQLPVSCGGLTGEGKGKRGLRKGRRDRG